MRPSAGGRWRRGRGPESAAERGAALLERLETAGVGVRLGRGGTLVLRGASRLSAALREEMRRNEGDLVEALLVRERFARVTTDRERH